MAELKKCPFCWGEAKIVTMQTDRAVMVVCGDCKASGRLFWDEKDAVEAWNRRAQDA